MEATHLAATGARIVEARKARGLSQKQLGRLTSIRPERLSRVETGRSELQVTELVRLSETLGVELEYLALGRSEIRNLAARAGLSEMETHGVFRVLRGLYAFHLALESDEARGEEACDR